MRIILNGNPISNQHAYGQHGKIRYMKKSAKDLKNSYIEQIKKQYQGNLLEEQTEIWLFYFFKDRRVRDADNYTKIVFDSLEGTVIINDKYLHPLHIYMKYDKENPRVEVTLRKVGELVDHDNYK